MIVVLYPRSLKNVSELKVGGNYYHRGVDPVKFLGQAEDGNYYFQFLDNPDYDMFGTKDLSQVLEAD